MAREVEAWRQHLRAHGLHILGGTLEDADAATTLRVRDGRTLLADGTYLKPGQHVTALDVLSCTGRDQAIQFAASHPLARSLAIEVRPFE